jgi:hypothetical protein
MTILYIILYKHPLEFFKRTISISLSENTLARWNKIGSSWKFIIEKNIKDSRHVDIGQGAMDH